MDIFRLARHLWGEKIVAQEGGIAVAKWTLTFGHGGVWPHYWGGEGLSGGNPVVKGP